MLADFTTSYGQAYAINEDNNHAYPIIGKRFDKEMQYKHPNLPSCVCMTNFPIKRAELIKENKKQIGFKIEPTFKAEIQKSADINNEGNLNKEIRDLVRIGLKHR